jgi:undecaprenyl-diphosphatase
LAFDVALHAGTLAAALLYFREDLWDMARSWFQPKDSPVRRENRRLGTILVAATVPALAAGYLFEGEAASGFRSPERIATALILGGILMAWVDRVRPQREELSRFRRRLAPWVGCFQALAILPGVSRSGITLTTLRLFELNRADAARLTFLLSIPVTAAAVVWEGRHLLGGLPPGEGPALLAGIAASGIAGYATLRAFMGFLRRESLLGFAVYRVVLGAGVLVWVWFSDGKGIP